MTVNCVHGVTIGTGATCIKCGYSPQPMHNHPGGPFMCAISRCPGNFQSTVARARLARGRVDDPKTVQRAVAGNGEFDSPPPPPHNADGHRCPEDCPFGSF